MPIYDVKCPDCGLKTTIWRTVETRDCDLGCTRCAGFFERLISKPMIAADCFNEYISPGTGKRISSPGARDDDLKRSGAILAEPGIEKDVARNRESRLEESFAPISSGIDNIVTKLVAEQKLAS